MKQKIVLNILLASMLACFASCKSSADKGKRKAISLASSNQVMKINIVNEPGNLDPRKARSLQDINLSKMFMEGLTRIRKDEEPTMAAAKSVDVSEDGLTYTFKMRDSEWSNGNKVTSYDFAYAWKRVLSPDFASDYASQLFVIKNGQDVKKGDLPFSLLGVTTPDAETLVVNLESPVPYFLKLVALPVFYPVNHQVDKRNPNWAYSVDTYVGNGPFKMSVWNHRDKIVATKNPSYWDAESVNLQEIEMLMVSQDTGLKMFENNEIQWEGSPYSFIPPDSLHQLKKEHMLNSMPALGTYWIQSNTLKGPLQSKEIRKALALAINRQDIVEFVTQGNQKPATGVVPMSLGLQEESAYFEDGDVRGAVAALEQGLADLNIEKEALNEIKLSYRGNEMSNKIAQVIQQQWFDTLGVNIQLQPLEAKVYVEKLSRRDFDLACHDWLADVADPINFLALFSSKNVGINASSWESPEFSQAIQSSFIAKDKSERREILKNAEKMIMDAMPVMPILNHSFIYVKDSHVKDVELNGSGQIDFKWAYIDSI